MTGVPNSIHVSFDDYLYVSFDGYLSISVSFGLGRQIGVPTKHLTVPLAWWASGARKIGVKVGARPSGIVPGAP
jgi:hypothetical protein